MNLKGWMSRAVIYQRHFVHYECQVYAKDINLSGLYMFVDISINIGLVIITCGAVIVTCDQAVLFLFDYF